MEKVISKNTADTQGVAKRVIEYIEKEYRREDEGHATVIGLYGDLGSGKTTFVKSVAKIFGVKDVVTSPTFVIEKIYNLNHKDFKKLYHIDAYRLKGGDDLLSLGWDAMLKDKSNLIFVEWPEYVGSAMPPSMHRLTFKFVNENTREIELALV